MPSQDEICELMDKLYIDLFDLIEDDIKLKVNMEQTTNAGSLMLAKARYIQGTQTVSTSQLPTEESKEFNALTTLNVTETDVGQQQLLLDHHLIDKEKGFTDPMNWFGILVPQSMNMAKVQFRKATEYAVECANIQISLASTYSNILSLYKMKE
jgi:hypothetical protein